MKIYHNLITIEDARIILRKLLDKIKLDVEEIDLKNSYGRILAEEISSKIDSPPFDRSEVDGYAVNHLSLIGAEEDNPVKLRVKFSINPGEYVNEHINLNEAAEISTGSMIPKGANAVVMEEYTKRIGEYVEIYRSVSPGENIAFTGSDVLIGDITLSKMTKLDSAKIALIASLGYSKIKVYRKIRAGILSTGNEILPPGEELKPGKLYDSNSYSIISYLNMLDIDWKFYGIARDDENDIKEKLFKAIEEQDIVFTSGSTSAGKGDLIYKIIEDNGKLIFHGLLIKPGKPTLLGIINDKIVIGLPGFPFSSLSVLEFLIKPVFMDYLKIPNKQIKLNAKSMIKIKSSKNVDEFIPVGIIKRMGEYYFYPVNSQSGSITSMIFSDGIAIIPMNKNYIEENENVEISLINNEFENYDIIGIGSCCPLLDDILIDYKKAKYIRTGSTAGWVSIEKNIAEFAGTHLLDENTLEYNIPFIEKYRLKGKAKIVRGYGRMQGFVVKKGNPKDIKSFEDLLREDVVIVNRVKGSGTRTLLDINLKKIAEKENVDFKELIQNIKGYYFEGKTHSSVAAAVSQGRADVGLTIEYYAYLYNLDFIPIQSEIFDLLVSNQSEKIDEFIEYFINAVKEKYKKYKGYKILEDTGKIYY